MAQIGYIEKRPRCKLCRYPSFGAFVVEYAANGKPATEELVVLCAECAFNRIKHNSGFGTRKLKAITLQVIFKLPPDKAPPAPLPPVPLEDDFVPSHYKMTFSFEGDIYDADLGDFPTEWAALERARQITHLTAKSMHLKNFWSVEHGIHRVPTLTKEDSSETP